MQIVTRKENWNGHTKRVWVYDGENPRCARCMIAFRHGEQAYLIYSDTGHAYVVCVECFQEYESRDKFLHGFLFKRMYGKCPIRISLEPLEEEEKGEEGENQS